MPASLVEMARIVKGIVDVRVTVLTWLESEQATAYDVVVDQVAAALERGGHVVSIVGVHGDLQRLVDGIAVTAPALVFNLMEMWSDALVGDVAVAGLLELVGVPFTGSGPGGLVLCQNKGLAKKLFCFDGIASPRFAVFEPGAHVAANGLTMPLIVKPLRGDASIGVDETRALVGDAAALAQRVREIHTEVHDAALAEEFVDGRELYVGIVGNDAPRALPIVEIDFSGLPDGSPRVVGTRAKFDVGSPEYRGTRAVVARLSEALRARVTEMALAAYRALGVCDYGRVDLRLTPGGDVYVLEVNASCYLEEKCELALAARAAGIDYTTLVNHIATLAVDRFGRRVQPCVATPICSS